MRDRAYRTAQLVERLRRGETLFSWDVHHSTLANAIKKGLVLCLGSCQLVLP